MESRATKRPSDSPNAELYPMRTVVSVTGMKAVTLRAWERRYGLIKPVRTPSGRRMYTHEHIERLHRIRALLGKGMPISQVSRSLATAPSESATPDDIWTSYRTRMAAAIASFDEAALDAAYDEALSTHRLDVVTGKLLMPLLIELGRRWESAEASVAEEHFFTMYVRNKLGARFHHRAPLARGPKLLCACAPREQHELGLLLFALAAHERGLRSIVLGANTPLAELATACTRARCEAIVISSSMESNPEVLGAEIAALVARASVPVYVGGVTSTRHRDAITAAGAVPLGTDLGTAVERLGADLAGRGVSA